MTGGTCAYCAITYRRLKARGLCHACYERLRLQGRLDPYLRQQAHPETDRWGCHCFTPEPVPVWFGHAVECRRCRRGIPS